MPNGAGEDDYQVIGWLLEANDQAGSVFEELNDLVDAVGADVRTHMRETLEVVEDTFSFIGSGFKTVISGLKEMSLGVASGVVQVNTLLQKYISLDSIAKGIRGAGGLIGMIMGPFGGILRLFSPLIDMLVEGLMPAMETFTAIVKTAFNPLFELAELLAQSLAPLAQELLTPFAEVLEILALQAALFVVQLVKGGREGGTFISLFQSLGPVLMQIFKALGGLGAELLPVVLGFFKDMAPVVMEVVKVVAQLAADLLPELGRIIKEVAPPVLTAFKDILKALLPLVPPLVKLGTTLLKDVFSPFLIATLKQISTWISDDLAPWLDKRVPVWVENIKAVTDAVAEFFGPNLGKYATQFKVLFIDPILEDVDEVVRRFKVLSDVVGIFAGEGTIGSKLEALGLGFGEGGTVVPGMAEGGILPAVQMAGGMALGPDIPVRLMGLLAAPEIPAAQDGLVATPKPRGRQVVVAEAGVPEIVMPLTARAVQAVIPPLLNTAIELPGLNEALAELKGIHKRLTGVLTVRVQGQRDAGGFGSPRNRDETNILAGAVGLSGIGG